MARNIKKRPQKPRAEKNLPGTPRLPPPSSASQYAQPLASEIVVDQEQSLELVKTVISAAISNITWVRDVFPNDCYESRVYDFSDPDPSYEAFMKGKKPFVLGKNLNLAYWRVLVRGSDPGVDKFLDWLEQGVAHALERKLLSTLQLSFYEGEVSSAALVEAYVVSITYANGVPSMRLDTESRAGKKKVATSLLLSDAKLGIRNLINGIIVSAQDLPGELPLNRVADMHLTYNDDCPKDYNPPGFRPCHDPNFIISDKVTTRCNSSSTGYHGIGIRLFSKSLRVAELASTAPLTTTVDLPSVPRKPSLSSETYDGETQESGLKALRSIAVTRNPAGKSQDTLPLHGTNFQQQNENGAASARQHSPFAMQQYSQPVKLRIAHAKQQREDILARCVDHDIDGSQGAGQNIPCECERPTCGDILLQCSICSNFRHAQCYGYLTTPPASEFVCYTCLLEGEDALISEMKLLCVKRSVLYHLREEGFGLSGKDLAVHLSEDEIAVKTVLDQLEDQGFIKVSTKQRVSRRVRETLDEMVFTLVNDEAKLRREYFCPDLNIAHHLALVETPPPGTLAGQSPQCPGPDGLWTTQPISSPSISNHNDSPQPLFCEGRARLREGSSTQGTPSPSLVSRCTSKLQSRTLPAEIESGVALASKKRAAETGPGGTSRKLIKVSSARSPWLFGRK